MPILDNAPGGTIFVNNNPLDNVIDITKLVYTGSADIANYSQYSFTPTILTHDIKTFDPFANGGQGYMDFNFQLENLNYVSEDDASNFTYSNTVGYPNNHYDITSFDALFTWDTNTEHVTGSKIGQNVEGRFVPLWSDIKNVIKNFMVEEAEPDYLFLQNDRIGVEGTGTAIHVQDGFHAKAGSKWHAHIGEVYCTKSAGFGNGSGNNGGGNSTSSDHEINSTEMDVNSRLVLIPNPTENEVSFMIDNNLGNETFSYYISNLSGELVMEGNSMENQRIPLRLSSGVYIVRLKTETTWYTEKLIIQ